MLPDVERWRRVLLCGAALLVLGIHGLLPWQPLRPLLDGALLPLARLLVPPATALAGLLATPSPPPAATAPASLAAAERRLGRPPEGLGVAWLEAPVVERRDQEGILVLAAGSRLGLAPGQPVVFGRSWLGRVLTAAAERAVVLLWIAPDARTGVRLVDEAGNGLRGVAQGRRAGRAPVVAWLEGEPWARPGMTVLWRARDQDPPLLEAGDFHLGTLGQAGDPARGESLWVVRGELPAGAEGRVWVGVGARAERLVAEPPVVLHPARPLLPLDAVLGPLLCQAVSRGVGPVAVALAGEQVLGPVVTGRGSLLWIRPLTAAAWRERAVALDPEGPRLLPGSKARDGRVQLFTRGGGGLPRGLWLGPAAGGGRPGLPVDGSLLVVESADEEVAP